MVWTPSLRIWIILLGKIHLNPTHQRRDLRCRGRIEPEWPLLLSQGFRKNDFSIKTIEGSKEKYLVMVIPKPPTVGRFRIILRAKGNASITVKGGYTEVSFYGRRFIVESALRSFKIKNQDSFEDYYLEGSLQDFPYSVKNGQYEDLFVKISVNGDLDVRQLALAGPVLDHVKLTIFKSQELSEHLNLEQWLKIFTLKAFQKTTNCRRTL